MLVQTVPRRFLSYRYKKKRSVAFKIRQISFSAGALPRTQLGELPTLLRPPSQRERGHPSPYPTPFGTNPPSALAMHPPQISSQIYAYAWSLTVSGTFWSNAVHNIASNSYTTVLKGTQLRLPG